MQKTQPGRIVTFERFGKPIRFFITQEDESIQRHLTNGRFYEEDDLELVCKHAEGAKTIFDIGANIGNHSIYFGTRYPGATIYPVELFPEVLALLEVNFLLNQHVHVDRRGLGVGLSSSHSSCDIVARFPQNRGLAKVDLKAENGTASLVPGDELFRDISPDFIKIDVEGHEMEVLKGLSATIAKSRPVLFVEVDDVNRDSFQSWARENNYQAVERIRRYKVNENIVLVAK